ncbi:hypothetical protein E4U55_004929 [Claviceps digitariae]|nr:hypothetical protein E4U55_004929 [Claviceps digitariae]
MAPHKEKSQLKRQRGSLPEDATESKKPRRSDRLSVHVGPADKTPVVNKQHLPSPLTHLTNGDSGDVSKNADSSPTPPAYSHDDQLTPRKTDEALGQDQVLSSPPHDTQPHSQYLDRHTALSDEVEDEVKEGVWGYLVPLDPKYGDKPFVLKKRSACPLPDSIAAAANDESQGSKKKRSPLEAAAAYDRTKINGTASGGYLIGRYAECDIVVDHSLVSNRHCLLFTENKGEDTIALVQDLSSNGTFVNDAYVGCNLTRELKDHDEIAVHETSFIFRYPHSRHAKTFLDEYILLDKLGKGHFAEVYLCIEKSTGQRHAVKIFLNRPGDDDRIKTEGLQQEIGVLMSVSHPNVLCLKDTYNEPDRMCIVLELAAEGELFNYIVMKQKLSEHETRKLFLQLFQGIKYLHDRNIVHRDIKPENILLTDKELHVKLADFGLSKIVGEDTFTTTLCGTPSYVAPEILADSRHRKYTKAVDIWSLGVVMYICLCGFPPFSDELYSKDHFPFSLKDQIRSGRFDYPSPFWDSVGDSALDLIDSMLVVNPERRFTVEQCLAHPWLTESIPDVNDSTDGLVGGVAGLKVDRRGPVRERTLLAAAYSVQVEARPAGDHKEPVKVFSKKELGNTKATKEKAPDHERAPEEFIRLGGKGDQQLFSDDLASVHSKGEGLGKKAKKTKARGR